MLNDLEGCSSTSLAFHGPLQGQEEERVAGTTQEAHALTGTCVDYR